MANWMIRLSEEYLPVLYDYLHEKLYDYHVIQADETPVLVNRDGRTAGSKSFMWVYRSGFMYKDAQIVLYEYQKTRNALHPGTFLKDYSGICVTDGYQVYWGVKNVQINVKVLTLERLRYDDGFCIHREKWRWAYDREVYCTIINPSEECAEPDQTRIFSTLDLYPTTLAELGVSIEGNRLGLRVILFSDEPTLIEQFGKEYVATELMKNSNYYTQNLLYGKK